METGRVEGRLNNNKFAQAHRLQTTSKQSSRIYLQGLHFLIDRVLTTIHYILVGSRRQASPGIARAMLSRLLRMIHWRMPNMGSRCFTAFPALTVMMAWLNLSLAIPKSEAIRSLYDG